MGAVMKWTQARNSVSGDYPVIEIEDENGVTVADAYEHAGLIEAAPDMLSVLKECESALVGRQETPERKARYERILAAIAKAGGK